MKRLKSLIILAMVFVVISGCNNQGKKEPMQSETNFLMDTVAQIDIYDNKDEIVMKKAFDRVYEVESMMSKTINSSDISRINKNAGEGFIEINDETYRLLERSIKYSNLTKGDFDPTIGPLVSIWKINDDEDRNWIPSNEEINVNKALVNYKDLVLKDKYVSLKKQNMQIDLGGIAKGYGADEAKKVLNENGVKSAIIDLGGNIYAVGTKITNEPWNIGIKDPNESGSSYIGIVSVEDKSVVTSGGYERFFEYDGQIYHHIIDPKTGYPAKSDLKSVTIISDSSAEGDAFATSFFVMGLNKTIDTLKALDNIDVILIDNEDNVYITNRLKDRFILKDEKYKLKLLELGV